MQHSNENSPTDGIHGSDPANQGGGGTSAESDGDQNTSDGRKGYGKRELSTSKRAAQNRAAQVRSTMS